MAILLKLCFIDSNYLVVVFGERIWTGLLYLRGENMDYRQQEDTALQTLKAEIKAGNTNRLYDFHGD